MPPSSTFRPYRRTQALGIAILLLPLYRFRKRARRQNQPLGISLWLPLKLPLCLAGLPHNQCAIARHKIRGFLVEKRSVNGDMGNSVRVYCHTLSLRYKLRKLLTPPRKRVRAFCVSQHPQRQRKKCPCVYIPRSANAVKKCYSPSLPFSPIFLFSIT